MSRTDDLACADLCEERGFVRPAEVLRAGAGGGLRLFAVVERAMDDGLLSETGGVPVAVHLDHEGAERDCLGRNMDAFTGRDLYEVCDGDLTYLADDLELDELERGMSAILGDDFRLPAPEGHRGPILLPGIPRDRIRAVMELFSLRFFYVAEVAFGGGGRTGEEA